jgi:hypothetical protein
MQGDYWQSTTQAGIVYQRKTINRGRARIERVAL